MNPLLFSQTNRESFPVMCAYKEVTNITFFQVSHFVLRNILQDNGEKETGKGGAEFPPDSLSPRLYFGAGLWEKTGEMILLFYSANMDAGWNYWGRF